MKREAKHLLSKAVHSLQLCVEIFNRPSDVARVSATLILLDHSFEMLLKSAILHRGGRIRLPRQAETIGFDKCIRVGVSNGAVRFLTHEQALLLQSINGLRDAAQHHLLDISEGQLYLQVQAGVTLFRDLLKDVFNRDVAAYLPNRVLPVSTTPPTNLVQLFESEIGELRKLLGPGRRRHIEAHARLRPLAILNATLQGDKTLPSDQVLRRVGSELFSGLPWTDVFPGVAAMEITQNGEGPTLALRLTKKEGAPVQMVPEGTPGASVVAVKRVNELDFYNLGARELAAKVGLTRPKLVAVVDHLGLRSDPDCYRELKVGKVIHKRYSQRAIVKIEKALAGGLAVDDVWTMAQAARRSTRE